MVAMAQRDPCNELIILKGSFIRSLKEKSHLMILLDDIGWVNLQINPEMISRMCEVWKSMYEVWKSLTTKIQEEILRRSIILLYNQLAEALPFIQLN